MSKKPTIGAAILTWKAPKSLRMVLSSHKESGLLDIVDQANIFYQEFDPEPDTALAHEFGWQASGSPDNLGIHRGMEEAVRAMNTDYVIYLENDCPCVSDAAELKTVIQNAIQDMEQEDAIVVNLRCRTQPGAPAVGIPKYVREHTVTDPIEPTPPYPLPPKWQANLRKLLRGNRANIHLGHAVYWEKNPAMRHPHAIRQANSGNWITDSRYAQWTNQPHIARRDTLMDVIFGHVRSHPSPKQHKDFQTVETALRCNWWAEQKFKISYADFGGYTHGRIDR